MKSIIRSTFKQIASTLGEKILSTESHRGELAAAFISGNNLKNWEQLLLSNGWAASYNGASRSPYAFCYVKQFEFNSIWGDKIQIFPRNEEGGFLAQRGQYCVRVVS